MLLLFFSSSTSRSLEVDLHLTYPLVKVFRMHVLFSGGNGDKMSDWRAFFGKKSNRLYWSCMRNLKLIAHGRDDIADGDLTDAGEFCSA